MPNHVHYIVGVDNSVFMASPAHVQTGFKPVYTDDGNKIDQGNKIDIISPKYKIHNAINPRLNPEMKIHGLFEFIKSFK
jgi:hypothetical protein